MYINIEGLCGLYFSIKGTGIFDCWNAEKEKVNIQSRMCTKEKNQFINTNEILSALTCAFEIYSIPH